MKVPPRQGGFLFLISIMIVLLFGLYQFCCYFLSCNACIYLENCFPIFCLKRMHSGTGLSVDNSCSVRD